ncbi:glutathione S-transferase family protein [Sphingomonas sp. PAMC 26617]|uniref:glutathione S-transferase family protein n=1 Tax=Sphingomonas sp. PAMC 26617 TaxID=1112216 RepID=UPI000287F8B6|nr:glutathione S-transferase family protein [Sphingomonas sp. PAMC 26617]
MSVTLYTNPMSRGRIARWMLEEVGTPYETVVLDYASDMKGEPFLAINPMGKVPAIVHDGHVVAECAAICAYLADAFPEAGLAPPLADRAAYYRWLFFAAGPVEQAVTNRSLGVTTNEPQQQRMAGYGTFDLTIETFAKAITVNPYFGGDRFSAVDVYAGSQVIWGLQFGSIPANAVFEDYAARVKARPAYRRASEIDDALIAAPVAEAVD